MNFLVPDLLTSVRNHIDADEVAPGQWVPDATMLTWLNRGVVRLWRKLARAGRIQPVTTTTSGAPPFVFGGDPENAGTGEPMVIYGVAEVLSDGTERPLRYAQSGIGTPPYQVQAWTSGSPAQVWWVTKTTTPAQYQVNVSPPGSSGTYRVTWLPRPLRLVVGVAGIGVANQIDIPSGMEEYPVLYTARMCFARAGAAPPSLQRLLDEMEAELDTAAETLAQGHAPRIINKDRELRGWSRRGQEVHSGWGNQRDWWWAP